MKEYKLTETEEKFAELIWQSEPIGSGDLVKLCEKETGAAAGTLPGAPGIFI